jgi:hypothetical protein
MPKNRSWTVGTQKVTVRPGAVQVNGNVPVETIIDAIDYHPWQYAMCYEKAYKDSPTHPQGTVVVGFDVLDQLPRFAKLVRSDFANPDFEKCVVGTLTGETINAAGAKGTASVVFPLVFTVK